MGEFASPDLSVAQPSVRGATPSTDASIVAEWSELTGLMPWTEDRELDGKLRRDALPFRVLDDTVVTDAKGHDGRGTVCETCGQSAWTITHCGRPLCIPCQRKRVGRQFPHMSKALIAGQARMDELSKVQNVKYAYRFVTVTLKSVPIGQLAHGVRRIKRSYQALRRTAFWKGCRVLGDLPRVEVTFSEGAWHVHVHSIVSSIFMPAGDKFGVGNLTDAWLAVTGDSFINKVESVTDTSGALRELVKYIFKPTDDMEKSISAWPDNVRRELAEVLAGPYRVVWFCPVHHARTRSECLQVAREQEDARLAGSGIHAEVCEGEYRLERQGFRPLLPSGIFREILREVKLEEPDKPSCHQCGLGNMRDRRWWENSQIMIHGWDHGNAFQSADCALNLIHAHEMTEEHGRSPLDLHYCMPSGWIPPPEFADFVPETRHIIVDMLREREQDFDGLLDRWTFGFDESRVLRLGLRSLENLSVVEVEYGTGIYRLNEAMLARLTGES